MRRKLRDQGDFRKFYDNLELLKSPSFGTEFSLCCPYIYLAHYDLITSETGRDKLEKLGYLQIYSGYLLVGGA